MNSKNSEDDPNEPEISEVQNQENAIFVRDIQDTKNTTPYYDIARLISLKVRRFRMSYENLQYLFMLVRQRCDLKPRARKGSRLIEIPTEAEFEKFFSVIRNQKHRLIFLMLDGSGLRVSELCNLEVHRIDFATNLVTVKQGKGSKDRVTVIGNRLREKLEIYLADKNLRYLFESSRGSKFGPRSIQLLCAHYRKKAGIKSRMVPHCFRHRYLSRLVSKNMSTHKVMQVAGHTSPEMTERYLHINLAQYRLEFIQALDGGSGENPQ